MLPSITSPTILALISTLALLPLAQPQFVDNLPRCIRDCINQSQYSNCQVTDIACLCRASAGNFLPDLVTCMHGNCIDINTNVLLGPLQFACELAGAPIPDSAVRNAESEASSLATQVTKTVTVGDSKTSVLVSTATVTTTKEGSTLTLLYPVTIEKTTTASGEPSTVTSVSPKDGPPALVPVVIVSIDSEGSTHTTTTTQSGAVSTYKTTDSEGSTVTQTTTVIENASSDSSPSSLYESSNSEDSSNPSAALPSSTVAGTETTSTDSAVEGTSETSSSVPPASQSNSAPFTNTNSAGNAQVVGNWFGLSVFLFMFYALL